jgi:NADH:ubiquinone reductase (H+-translocating)
MNPHRIAIAGAGYAGVSCALRLARRAPSNVAITLVSATDRFIERIRLHQRATGQSVGDWSLRALIRGTGVELRIGNIDQLDYGNRVLKLGGERLEFDTLVLALGSHVDVDSVAGVREHAMAVEFGTVSNIHRALQKVATHRGRVTIVGGGLTGIELASEIAESFPGLQVSLGCRSTCVSGQVASSGIPSRGTAG